MISCADLPVQKMNRTCNAPAVLFDNKAKSDTLLVSLGYIRDSYEEEHLFDFMGVTSDIPVKRLFLGDPWLCWYYRGIPGFGDSIDGIACHIKALCAQEQIKRVVTVGLSGGAYAAILFGILINADEVIAFNPLTKLKDRTDTFYPDRLMELHNEFGKDHRYLDLRKLKQEVKPQTWISIFYAANNRKDTRHAKYLGGLENVKLISYPFFSHHLATFLAKRGELTELLRAILIGSKAEIDSSIRRSKRKAYLRFIPTCFALFVNRMKGYLKRFLIRILGDG